MAHVRKGLLTGSKEWWKHLRWTKRAYWHGERRAVKRDVREQLVAMPGKQDNELQTS